MSKSTISIRTAIIVFGCSLAAAPALAGTDTDDLPVSASVTASCQITAGEALSFGTYDTISGAALDGQADLTVACTKGATATIMLGQGANPDSGSSNAAPLRRLKSGSDFLSYQLFSDEDRENAWGNTAGTGASYTAASASDTPITVFGTIDANQDVPVGNYTDTVVATISF